MSSSDFVGADARLLNWSTLRTRDMSWAASRPQVKARLFISIAAPLISMARSSASSDSGIAPFWKAKPSMKGLVAMRIAHQRRGDAGGVDDVEVLVADGVAQHGLHRAHLEIDVGVLHEARGRLQVGVDDRPWSRRARRG